MSRWMMGIERNVKVRTGEIRVGEATISRSTRRMVEVRLR